MCPQHKCSKRNLSRELTHGAWCSLLLQNYETPWDGVYFLHADINTAHHGEQHRSLLDFLNKNRWPKWPATRFQITHEHAGCGRWASTQNAFGPKDFWHLVMTWWLGQSLVPRDPSWAATHDQWVRTADCHTKRGVCNMGGVGAWPLHNGTLSSCLGFMFAIDRAAALQRSRRWLEAQYRMCKVGVRVLPPGMKGAPRAARLPAPGFDYAPLVYGHVNERIPFFAFGYEFEERPPPDCIWHGDHATMNCTQPEIAYTPDGLPPTQALTHAPKHNAAEAKAAAEARVAEAKVLDDKAKGLRAAADASAKAAAADDAAAREAESAAAVLRASRPHARHANATAATAARPNLTPATNNGCKPFDRNCGTVG